MTIADNLPETFTAAERDYIRRELDLFFSTLPSVADGFPLKTWRGGEHAGKPKVLGAALTLVERGLMRVEARTRAPQLFFTERGMQALKAMMSNARFADPAKFAHIREELGLNKPPTRHDV